MAKVENVKQVQATLRGLQERAENLKGNGQGQPEQCVVVGFTQNYALYVHEDLEARHPIGQAKYLEQPARTLQNEIVSIVRQFVAKGQSLLQGLLVGGLRLQRESQLLVPVDTSALKNSAFTRIEPINNEG